MYGKINSNGAEKMCDLNTACCYILTHYFHGNFDLHKATADLMRHQIPTHITNYIYKSENPHRCL